MKGKQKYSANNFAYFEDTKSLYFMLGPLMI